MIELRRRYSGGSDSPSFSRLPKGYQEVEYLQGDGNAYLVIHIIPQVGDSFDLDLALNAANSHGTSTIVYRDSNVENRFGVSYNKNSLYLQGNALYYAVGYSAANDERHLIHYQWGESEYSVSVKKNNEVVKTYSTGRTATFNSISCEIPLFCYFLQNSSSPMEISKMQVYGYTYYRNEKIFANLIPCRRISDNEKGMYDIVNNVFYTNAGTGEFSVGPDVHYNIPPEYQQVEYLQDTGTQRLKLPVKMGGNFIIEAEVAFYSGGALYRVVAGWSNAAQIAVNRTVNPPVWCNFHSSTTTVYNGVKYNVSLQCNDYASLLYVNGDSIISNSNINKIDNLQVFGFENSTLNMYGAIYFLKITGDINMHLIPCYSREDNEAGMYDIVNGVFYTNAGTGEFIVGPEVIG